MKLYTKEDFLKAAEFCEVSMIDAKYIIERIDEVTCHIELPSDEEIKTYLNNHSYEFEHGFKDAIEFMKNKIQGGNKWK